ncbi:MAG TPA: hypothetical protein VNL69_10705 [Bacteroidota bacterium]|nr:hypothetical protein [Bacteroidota bacterium]
MPVIRYRYLLVLAAAEVLIDPDTSAARSADTAKNSVRCYVWDFAMRNGTRNELTRQLTVEFEEKLTQGGACTVLERRNFSRFIAQKDNERAILRLDGVSQATVDTLKSMDANTVVFGEVYDDVNSGSYKVTVTFQNFDNAKRVWSVRIPRGIINDAGSREKAMGDLVRMIEDEGKAAERETNRRLYYLRISKTLNEFVLRAKNVKDAFRYLPDLAYGNKNIAEGLRNAVVQYNVAVESLRVNQDALPEEVSANWQNPELAENFRYLLRYALLDIHETEILVFNDMLVKIMAILNGRVASSNDVEMTKAHIKTTVPTRVESVSAKLVKFEQDARSFLDSLKP